jgi:predicted DCC family thiol-disulfide oxidoreductase YuxK
LEIALKRKVILFDGACNLCNSAIQFVIKHDKQQKFYFASLQSDYGQKILATHSLQTNDLNTLIYQDGDKIYVKSEAVIRIGRDAGGWLKIAVVAYVLPLFIRDYMYNLIAKNRYKIFGMKNQCMIPEKGLQHRFLQ